MVVSRLLQFSLWSLGIASAVWAYTDPRFRDGAGFLQGTICLPVALGIALIILGCTIVGQLRRPGFWFALALGGQAVALQMIEAGTAVRYQHYKPLGRLLIESHPFLLLYLAAQTTLVLVALRRYMAKIRASITGSLNNLNTWRLLGVVLVFFFSSATVSKDPSIYVAELLFATFVQTVNVANLVLVVGTLPEAIFPSLRQKLGLLFEQPEGRNTSNPRRLDWFPVCAAIWVVVLASVFTVVAYQQHPHISDEVSYLYQARYFARGILTMPIPSAHAAFDLDLMHYEADRWYSPFPPGWPFALAVGVLMGVPWLVNPVLAAVNVLLTYLLIRDIYDRRTARMTVLLLCISPWYVFMGMNFMPHTFTLTCALAASLSVIRARRTGAAIWGLLAGSGVGVVSLIRPLDGLLLGGLLGFWAIGVGGPRLKTSAIATFVLGSVLVGGLTLPYNDRLTGDPARFPVNAYFDKYYGPKTNALGFGPERGVGWPIDPFPGHGPVDALVNANLNTYSMNVELFGWSTGSLIMIAVLLFSRSMKRSDFLMLSVILATIGVYSLYWFSGGPDFGARYWYLAIVPCVVLTVRGFLLIERMVDFGAYGFADRGPRVIAALLCLCILALVNYFPWRAIDKYYHYRGMRPDVRLLAKEYSFGKSLVLIRGERFPDYASAAVYNHVNFHDQVPLYAWDKNPEVQAQVLTAYSDRPVWVVEGPTITRNGFKVIDGPLSAHELLSRETNQTNRID